MGNAIAGSRTVKVMKVDGTTFRVKPPATAGQVVANHPGYHLLGSSDVKRLSIHAPPLEPSHPLKSGKVYFLVELPRSPDMRLPRRAWSGALNVTARDRLESLKLSRRSVSDLSIRKTIPALPPLSVSDLSIRKTIQALPPLPAAAMEIRPEGPMQLRVRIPRAQLDKIMEENIDAAEAAARIVELFLVRKEEKAPAPAPVAVAATGFPPKRKEKKTRFMVMQDQVVA